MRLCTRTVLQTFRCRADRDEITHDHRHDLALTFSQTITDMPVAVPIEERSSEHVMALPMVTRIVP